MENSGALPARLSPGIVTVSNAIASCRGLPDSELMSRLGRVCSLQNRVAAVVVAHLAEFDERKLWAGLGYSSLFSYCVTKLRMSEQAAYKRIAAARAARRFPQVLEWLGDGRVHLSAVAILAPHFCAESVVPLLEQAAGKSKYDLEKIVAALSPRPDRGDSMRALPLTAPSRELPAAPVERVADAAPAGPGAGIGPPAPTIHEGVVRERVKPLSPRRVSFTFTGSEDLRDKLKRVQELTWHSNPAGRLEFAVEKLADFYLDRKDPDRRLARRRRKAEAEQKS